MALVSGGGGYGRAFPRWRHLHSVFLGAQDEAGGLTLLYLLLFNESSTWSHSNLKLQVHHSLCRPGVLVLTGPLTVRSEIFCLVFV